MNALFSKPKTVFAFLRVIPALLHTVLVPVKIQIEQNISAMVPSALTKSLLIFLKQKGDIMTGRSGAHKTGSKGVSASPEFFSRLAKSPALLVFLAGTLTSLPVVCCLCGK